MYFINLNSEKARQNARISQIHRRHSNSTVEITVEKMSESIANTAKSAPVSSSMRNRASDLRMLAEVEKWMATIREINREQPTQSTFAAIN